METLGDSQHGLGGADEERGVQLLGTQDSRVDGQWGEGPPLKEGLL